MTSPSPVKGWCPGAYKPMMSGDGLIVRVRPIMAHLEAAQIIGLCEVACRFGNGTIDLTSRANLQIRGILPENHDALLQDLARLGLLDVDPTIEAKRNILVTPHWTSGDLTDRLGRALLAILPALPNLPAKTGFAIDTGPSAQLQNCSADFRFELTQDGQLILRADGADTGRSISEQNALDALQELIQWYLDTDGPSSGRMKRHLAVRDLPDQWAGASPRDQNYDQRLGRNVMGWTLVAPFGQIDAKALATLVNDSLATAMRVSPHRRITLLQAQTFPDCDFVTAQDNPALNAHACPGAPACPHASVQTRTTAMGLIRSLPAGASLHVSGCEKGCAFPHAADYTLVGRNGAFDLVRNGAPWDEPADRGLSQTQLNEIAQL
ncbi:MAG: cobalamin biosynthesis protein CobG [Paracoccaceae bacterium]